jgi:membrane fusion protein, protease secretion system
MSSKSGSLATKILNSVIGFAKRFDLSFSQWLGGVNPYSPEKLKSRNLEPVDIQESPVRKTATKIFLGGFAFFLVWAVLAPMDEGVVIPGSVTVQGNRKQVQHPSGGVVTEILVKEGEEVSEGQVLIKVNPLNSEANLTSAELQYINLLATESRLLSERDGRASIAWSPDLEKIRNERPVREAKNIQQKLFNTRRSEYTAAVAAKRIEVETLTTEARNAEQLAKEGFMPQAQASAALRAKVIAEAALSQLMNGRQTEIGKELAETQKNRDALQQRVQSLAFDADLNNIKAPVTGVVTGLKVNTIGGVISGTQILMEVVPREEILVIEAKVPTNQIDKVRKGMEADLRFTAFNERTTPVIQGTVTLVGADKISSDKATDLSSQNPQGEYYLARIETTPDGQKKLGDKNIQPGMPVEVIVKAGERNFLSYVLKPLTDNFAKAFLN